MSRSAVQFQKGLSLPEFQRLYGNEEQCEAALEKVCCPLYQQRSPLVSKKPGGATDEQ